jgi:DNA gyrase/topoisomerase IV subunit A
MNTTATKNLDEVVALIKKLPEEEQKTIVEKILKYLDDAEWEKLINSNLDALDKLTEEAIAEHRAGFTEPLFKCLVLDRKP